MKATKTQTEFSNGRVGQGHGDAEGAAEQAPAANTIYLGKDFDVKGRLANLYAWEREWKAIEQEIADIRWGLDLTKAWDRERGGQLASLAMRYQMIQVKHPVEVSLEALVEAGGYPKLRQRLALEFGNLTKVERAMWLTNFLLLLTPDMRKVIAKIEKVQSHRAFGQGRCFMLGAPSGMGKSTLLNYIVLTSRPRIADGYNEVPIAMIDATVTNHTAKAILRRFVSEYGATYLKSYDEEDLLNMLAVLIPRCKTRMLAVDEIAHLKSHALRRRLLEISNRSTNVPILVSAVNPERFADDDPEIQGRWNDYIRMEPYKDDGEDKTLASLLTFIGLLLPFGEESYLPLRQMPDGSEGPLGFIQEYTGGILKRIMILLSDAISMALEEGRDHLPLDLIKRAAQHTSIYRMDGESFTDVLKRAKERVS